MAKPQRAFALVAALLLLLSAVGGSALIIWQMVHKDPAEEATAQALANLQKQQAAQAPESEGALAGKQLENFTPVSDVSQLQYVDLKVGTGAVVPANATVTAHYTGALAKTGVIFESSKDTGTPATFPLNQVILGWQQGVPGMKVGGTRRLIIPANLAYGAQGRAPKIGPNEPLVFDIELVKIEQ